MQGDIVKIIDENKTVVATYEYDDWGKLLTSDADLTDIAELNPFRYRGYYYDTESGLYYLNSRYYDPETGRFINADAYVSTGQGLAGNNMFAYCNNNPVNYVDYLGTKWFAAFFDGIRDWFNEKIDEKSSKQGTTYAFGGTASASVGIGGNLSLGLTFDNKGNLGIIGSAGGGGGMPSLGVGIYGSITNAPSIYAQEGLGTQTGGSASVLGGTAGLDHCILFDDVNNVSYQGISGSATLGFDLSPVEFHSNVGYSMVWGFNIYEAGLTVVNWISPEE